METTCQSSRARLSVPLKKPTLAIDELMALVDTTIPDPVRDLDQPFLMAVESVYSIAG